MSSPKHKFFGTIDLVVSKRRNQQTTIPISVSGNTIEEVKSFLMQNARSNAHLSCEHKVVIKENKAEYPKHDWVEVESTNMFV